MRELDRRRSRQRNTTILSRERFPIEELRRWMIYDGDSIVIEVRWADGSPDTWEPEEILHIDTARTLLDFWRRRGGRTKATGLRESSVLRILEKKVRRSEDKPSYKCQWIGLPARDRYVTWLSQHDVTDVALPQ
ncbi:hypothetical protein FBEOM_999 [Fusarium beomiforme]|uniref:Chromo domain-containing protein n=1 Tax=Fusarium beomiforme TaxID=44412 RepID=A0A9P5AUC6_9HYPO|nr:hypothetical protein FBEOM_999 [Fusarium beomiforme]